MASAKERSYWACVFSILHLLRGPEKRDLWDPEKAPQNAYIWTWTFPDVEARADASVAMRRWKALVKDLTRTHGFKFVRVLERGAIGEGCHFHGVTGDWWSVEKVRDLSQEHGFGRVNARWVPLHKALYLAKYVRKTQRNLDGFRKWACVGFQGVTSQDVKIRQKVFDVVPLSARPELTGWVEWRFPDSVTVRHALRSDALPTDPVHIMEIKASALKLINEMLIKGARIGVGEYRGTQVREVNVDDWKTKQSTTKIIAEHTVEFGGEAVKVGQWLPPGSSKDKVIAPAQKGEAVLVEIESETRKYGISAKSIRTLASLV